MKLPSLFRIATALQTLLFLPHHLAQASHQQQLLGHKPLLRNATLSDADAISTVIIAAFAPLPYWQYLYQFREEFPEEHRRCGREQIVKLLDNDSWYIEVIEAPIGSKIPLMAIAIWTRGVGSHMEALLSDKCTHKDLNITRAIDYDHKFTAAKRKYVDAVFGPNQLYLELLATHPHYQQRGAGSRLVHRGIQKAHTQGQNVTLIAQPTAQGFYQHLGFTQNGIIRISSVDGDIVFPFPIMSFLHS